MADLYGIDVSRWQKGFNLQNAINEGFTYIILKAGGGDKGLYKDIMFDQFYKQAKSLPFTHIGAYFFGEAFSVESAVREANAFMSYLQGTAIKKVYYDVEGKMMNQDRATLTNIVKAFCDTVNAAGYICGVYSSEHYFNNGMVDKDLKKYPHWVAKYSKNQPKLNSGNAIEMWQYGGSKNFIRSPKIAGTVVDQNFIYIQWDNNPVKEKTGVKAITGKSADYETIHKIAEDVLNGKYGSGELRKKALGDLYEPVQAEVNAIVKQRANQPVVKTTEQLANEVLAGLWGTGLVRKVRLGKRYNEVQALVDKLVKERSTNGFNYTVVKGDTLSKIAKKYNVTVKQIMEINGIEDPNKIWVGQMLKIS